MKDYQRTFIFNAENCGALKIGSYTLKSGRPSPWFFDLGTCYTGELINDIAEAYAQTLLRSEMHFDSLYGIPEKASHLSGPIAIRLAKGGKNASFFSIRTKEKEHGEGTNISTKIVGKIPKEGAAIVQIDDVFTTGATKYEERKKLENIGKFTYPLLIVGIDRQEKDEHGQDPIEEYEKTTGTKVLSVVTATQVYEVLKHQQLVKTEGIETIIEHLMEYGTAKAREEIERIKERYSDR